mgnify:CR=1 FL=1
MISQELIDTIQDALDWGNEIESELTAELLTGYIKLIEDSAELHKEIAKLRTENNELYQESAKDKGL